MDKNQEQEKPEEYTGILGDFQESAEEPAPAAPPEEQETRPQKNNPLKIAGIAVASAAILGCLAFAGVKLYNTPERNAEVSSQAEISETSAEVTSLPQNATAAAYSQNCEISKEVMQCFYYNYLKQYASALSYYGIDTETMSLKEQKLPEETGEDITWFDYIMNQAKTTASQLLIFQEAANEDGYTLSDYEQNAVAEELAGLDPADYGENVTENDLKTMLELEALASSYVTNMMNHMEFTEEELENYYQENKTTFDSCSIMGFGVHYQLEEASSEAAPEEESSAEPETEAPTEMPQEQAKELAEQLMQAASPEEFEEQVRNILTNYENASEEELSVLPSSIREDNFTYSEGFDAAEWAFSGTAKVGETHMTEREGSYNVYYLVSEPTRDETQTVNVRHILFMTENYLNQNEEETTSETSELSAEDEEAAQEAALETCRKYAENTLKEWENGDRSEESFAELAERYSEDGGSNKNGGLYEDVLPGQMVETFNDWCFDSSRKPGDTGIVETNYGMHVMYFSGIGDPSWKGTAKSMMKSEKMDSWYSERKTSCPVAVNDDVISSIEG